jgi:hypothetical protein
MEETRNYCTCSFFVCYNFYVRIEDCYIETPSGFNINTSRNTDTRLHLGLSSSHTFLLIYQHEIEFQILI